MWLRDRSPRQRAILSAVALIGAAGLFLANPSRGQQNLPAIHFSVPAAVAGGAPARVQYDLTLPPGLPLARNPRVRVLNDKGQLWELLPMYITQRSPSLAGYRDLNTENYPPGQYRVSVEVDTVGAGGQESTAASPAVTVALAAP